MVKQKILTGAELGAEKQRTRLFGREDWLVTILAQPELEDICPWQLFDEKMVWGMTGFSKPWHAILAVHPEMIKHAPVPFPAEYLDACDWADILILHPQLKSKVPWENLTWKGDKKIRLAWMNLLIRYPAFAKYCRWSIFYHHIGENNPNEWIRLLQLRPEFIKNYLKLSEELTADSGITLITPHEWAMIIALRPELLPYAPKKNFTNENWQEIIARQPHLCPERMKKAQL